MIGRFFKFALIGGFALGALSFTSSLVLAAPANSQTTSYDYIPFNAFDITGLDDPKCCKFPLEHRTNSFLFGEGHFRSGRNEGGREHAGADLYGRRHEPIHVVANGIVIRAAYRFKDNTYAIDIEHEGGFVIRYGEIEAVDKSLVEGATVQAGQVIAKMGKTNGNPPMLHFELFRGSEVGKLTRYTRGFDRRRDLVDPTPYLSKWMQTLP